MKKNKITRFLLTAVSILVYLTVLSAPAFARGGESTTDISGSILWDDSDNLRGLRPPAVTVHLLANGTEVAYSVVSADEGWYYSFTVSVPDPVPAYTVIVSPVDGYCEDLSRHRDPAFEFEYPAAHQWIKYEPCNELAIPADKLSHEIIAGKMTKNRPLVIWSSEALTALEQELVQDSILGLPGVGNPSSVLFLIGSGSEAYGMTIDSGEGRVLFDDPSNWSLLFGGEYTNAGYDFSPAAITFSLLSSEPEEPLPSDEPDDFPGFGGELEPPEPPEETQPSEEPLPSDEPGPSDEPEPPEELLPPKGPLPSVEPEPSEKPLPSATPVPTVVPTVTPTPSPSVIPTSVPTQQPPSTRAPHPVITPRPTAYRPIHVLDVQPKTGMPDEYGVLTTVLIAALIGVLIAAMAWILLRYFRAGTGKWKWAMLGVLVMLTIAALSAADMYSIKVEMKQAQANFEALAPVRTSPVPILPENTQTAAAGEVPHPAENAERFAPLLAANSDFAAWLSIEGTKINYPVMSSPAEPDKYLHLDFNENESISGTPYIGAECELSDDNIIIYGHNMRDGSMFAALLNYEYEQFFRQHPTISFDTVDESSDYGIIAAFPERIHYQDETDVFRYYDYTGKLDASRFEEYVEKIRDASLYDTGRSAQYGDQLITLSTCAYHVDNGRFVVVAVKL